ncbi:MAG TPA: FAD:protein FMN transferase [Tepidiformaceae bacterium]|nr:FAD:protein FMN transferase [Tepidiformaceae bacterium]
MRSVTASRTYMDTLVTIEVVGAESEPEGASAMASAFGWFREVERRCSRFDPESELMQLCETVGKPVVVSQLLFSALDFAVTMAVATNGAFDPSIGRLMEARGFDTNYRTGERLDHAVEPGSASFRDVRLDRSRRSVTLRRPMVLDLGAVAKGLAIDLASQALRAFPGFVVDAGGDLYASGVSPTGEPWRIGIHHPRNPGTLIDVVQVGDMAVCTSGDYERAGPRPGEHHLVDARTGRTVQRLASVTAIAPTAMVADAMTTAAFALGPEAGVAFLEQEGVDAMLLTPGLERYETRGFGGHRA